MPVARKSKFLNNIVEQDHRRVKRLVRPGLGFGDFQTARRTLAGYEAMVRKGQVRGIGGRDIRAHAERPREIVPDGGWRLRAPVVRRGAAVRTRPPGRDGRHSPRRAIA